MYIYTYVYVYLMCVYACALVHVEYHVYVPQAIRTEFSG